MLIRGLYFTAVVAIAAFVCDRAWCQPTQTAQQSKSSGPEQAALVKLAKEYDIWANFKKKELVISGVVCLRRGQLEMFACPKHTKEHESIVSVNVPARFIHAGLLAVGAKSGRPVQYDPEYRPATGSVIEIDVTWTDKDGKKHTIRAQEWIKDIKTGKPMPHDWVFAGSSFVVDETSGEKLYYADGGELVCVSNFPSALLDLPIKSGQENSTLLFEAMTNKIPALGTPVQLILRPQKEEKKD